MALPRLCYVTDAGENEYQYYTKVLCRLRDPRNNHKYLHWHQIIDYFHTTETITVMAEALFGSGREASTWARRMRKHLRKPNGASRMLHSAAAMRSIYGLKRNREKDFDRAYNYIRSRTRHMRYAEFSTQRIELTDVLRRKSCVSLASDPQVFIGAECLLDDLRDPVQHLLESK